MGQLSKGLLILLFLVAMLAKQEVISTSGINDKEEEAYKKILIAHSNLISMEKYTGYMMMLKKKCFAAVTDPHFTDAEALAQEIVFYNIPALTFKEIKNHHLLVIGYFRSTVVKERYNNDIGHLLLQYAYIDWLKENSSIAQLKQQLWNGKRPAEKAIPILKLALSFFNYTFITEWLLSCMERTTRGDQLDLSYFKDFFVESVQKSIFLSKDNFLNVPLLNWLRETLPSIEKMFQNPDEIIYLDRHKIDYYNPYLSIWLKNSSITAEDLSAVVQKAWEKQRFPILFPLALHGKLKKAHFPANYPVEEDVIKLLSYKNKRNQANLLRYYLRFFISKKECKKILMNIINNFYKYKKSSYGIFNNCYFPKEDTYFSAIFRKIKLKTKISMYNNSVYYKGVQYQSWNFAMPRR